MNWPLNPTREAAIQASHAAHSAVTNAEQEVDRAQGSGQGGDPMTETTKTTEYTADVMCTRGTDVLLIVRGDAPYEGQLALPGGFINSGETFKSAAARELQEETGVVVDPDALVLVGVYDRPDRDPRGRVVTVAYRVDLPSDTNVVATAGDDAAAVQWVPLDALLTTDADSLAFDHGEILYAAWRQQLAAGYARQVEIETSGGRCPAAHPSDPSDCAGPVAVTVVNSSGTAGLDGCEHHAARMLASLPGARVYALPDASEGAAGRTFKAASGMPPYA
ncbi:NUDIX hydrolase [Streptomyces sp. NPDC021354]|uniref:NUDIX hydrolase n=1 Tax=Streptomyces sp. NPDC021354 TaxID=3154793 RepID=UPI0033C5797F